MRIKSNPGDANAPRIDPDTVAQFFEDRAKKAEMLGPIRAVIYQDKHPDLAEKRNAAEKTVLLPLLDIQPTDRVLDIGCGTGRWAPELSSRAASYHGADFSSGLIDIARREHAQLTNSRFSVVPSVSISLQSLGETVPFDKILIFGLFIYLNDEDVTATLARIATVAAQTCRILIREPIALGDRLTIKEHFSEDLDQIYNAIYRTQGEILAAFDDAGLKLIACDDVYKIDTLNNRMDTRQKWFHLERR